MLITFESKAYANITMFGDVAKKLIHFMGHSGTIPSAIKAQDLPLALSNLKDALKQEKLNRSIDDSSSDNEDGKIDLHKRAIPLLEMLDRSIKSEVDIYWDKE